MKYVPSLGDICEWNSSQWNYAQSEHHSLAHFQFKKGFTGMFTAVPLPSTSRLKNGDSPQGRKDYSHWYHHTRRVLFPVPHSGLTFLWGFVIFYLSSFLFFHLCVLELFLCFIRESFISCQEMKNNLRKRGVPCHLLCAYLLHIFNLLCDVCCLKFMWAVRSTGLHIFYPSECCRATNTECTPDS